jgi:hypothetical protein
MFTYRSRRCLAAGALAALALASCSSNSPTAPAANTAVVSIAPLGGSAGVSTGMNITVMFSDSMMAGVSAYMSMHQGSVTGPTIAMTAHWSVDHHMLTMTPNAPLTPGTTYFIHMGGGMTDANGQPIDYSACPGFGGQAATSGMMGGMMGEMGSGWMGSDGKYGMVFSFTTA